MARGEKRGLRRSVGFAFLVLLMLLAQGTKAKPVLKISKNIKTVTVHQEADQLEYDDKSKVMRLRGHVKLTQADTVLEADEATYYLNSEEAEAAGNLKLTRPDGILTGHHLHLYYREKRAFFDGHVSLIRFLEKNKNLKENEMVDKTPVKILADELDYRWEAKIATARGNVELVQGERKAYADQGVYNEPLDRLEMEGHVQLIRPPKDELACDHLVYYLTSNEAKADGHVHGKFVVKEHPEKKKNNASLPASAPGPSPAADEKPQGPIKP